MVFIKRIREERLRVSLVQFYAKWKDLNWANCFCYDFRRTRIFTHISLMSKSQSFSASWKDNWQAQVPVQSPSPNQTRNGKWGIWFLGWLSIKSNGFWMLTWMILSKSPLILIRSWSREKILAWPNMTFHESFNF